MGVDVTSDRTSRSITIICLHHVEDNIFVGESQPVRQLSIIGGYMARHWEEATHLISAIFWRVTILYSILRMVNSCLSSVIFKGWFFWFSFGCGGMSRALPWLQQQRICLHAGFGSTIARESQPTKKIGCGDTWRITWTSIRHGMFIMFMPNDLPSPGVWHFRLSSMDIF